MRSLVTGVESVTVEIVDVQLFLELLLHRLGKNIIWVDLRFQTRPSQGFVGAIPLEEEIDLEMEGSLPLCKNVWILAKESIVGTNYLVEELQGLGLVGYERLGGPTLKGYGTGLATQMVLACSPQLGSSEAPRSVIRHGEGLQGRPKSSDSLSA